MAIKMSNLPRDLLEEILSRVPVNSMRVVRSICKEWNTLFEDGSLMNKYLSHQARGTEFQVVLMMGFKVYLMSFNLHGIYKDDHNVVPVLKSKAKLISLNDGDRDYSIYNVFHCDGLLLCIISNIKSRLVVWNPFCGKTKWIKPLTAQQFEERCALGYEQKNNNSLRTHKILILKHKYVSGHQPYYVSEIYNINSESWKVVADSDLDRDIEFCNVGVSLKGNTYWYADTPAAATRFLICFDFTAEIFGPHLPLPFHSRANDIVALSSVREEQLAVLFRNQDTKRMEIWITTKIEPREVSWIKFFTMTKTRPHSDFHLYIGNGSFFIDEKNKVVVIFGKHPWDPPTRNIAYIFGKDRCLRHVDLGESTGNHCFPQLCSRYRV